MWIKKFKRKQKPKRVEIFFSIMVGILIFSVMSNLYFILFNANRNRVVKVVDGDSFETKDGRRIRLLSVDAPSLDSCMGLEAKEALEIMIGNRIIRLADTVKDDYGRSLSNVFSGSAFINKEMIKRGLGKYTSVGNKHQEELSNAALGAREDRLGIFSSVCRQMEPPAGGCIIKANIRQGKRTYHLPECRNYSQVIIDTSFGDQWFCSEEEAKAAGFEKAGGC